MIPLETFLGRAALLASLLLMALGSVDFLVTVVGLAGPILEAHYTGDRASASLIVLLCAALLTGGGIMLYRRIEG